MLLQCVSIINFIIYYKINGADNLIKCNFYISVHYFLQSIFFYTFSSSKLYHFFISQMFRQTIHQCNMYILVIINV